MAKMWFKAICKKRFRNGYLLPIKDKFDRINFDARDIPICADRRPAVYSGFLLSAACDFVFRPFKRFRMKQNSCGVATFRLFEFEASNVIGLNEIDEIAMFVTSEVGAGQEFRLCGEFKNSRSAKAKTFPIISPWINERLS